MSMRTSLFRSGALGARIGVLALAMFAAAALASCNTTEGVGKDVKAVGTGIEEGAREAKD